MQFKKKKNFNDNQNCNNSLTITHHRSFYFLNNLVVQQQSKVYLATLCVRKKEKNQLYQDNSGNKI